MPPSKKVAHVSSPSSAPAPAPVAVPSPVRSATPSVSTTTLTASIPASHAAADAAEPSASQFPPPQSSRELTQNTTLEFMIRAIYQYLSQFGFEETAEQLKTDFGARFDPNPLTAADESESHLRCSMYRTFTLTAVTTPNIQDSAEIVLDDLNLLLHMARMPRTVDSLVFEIERELRIAACMAVVDDPTLFEETRAQYFPADLLLTASQATAVDNKLAAQAHVADAELRKHHLYYQQLHLVDYRKNRATVARLDPKSPVAQNALAAGRKFESEHTREELQQDVRVFLKDLLDKLQVQGAVFLEQVSKSLLSGDFVIDGEDEEDEEEFDESQTEEEGMDESMEVNPKKEEFPYSSPDVVEDDAEEEEEESTGEPREEIELRFEADESESSPVSEPEPEPEPVKVAPVKRGPGRPPRVAPVRASARVVPDAVRQLEAASATLKDTGLDPLAESLRSTQVLSKRRISHEEKAASDADEEEDVHVSLEEEEEQVPAPPKRKRGRPRKVPKYDREQTAAEKVEFSDAEQQPAAVESKEDDDAESLPEFKTKKTSGRAAANPKTPTQMAPASDAGQRGRPAVHRHAVDRASKRVPWSTAEIEKLTEGVLEFASQRKKWALILSKYNEFFQDRTVVDLKDKWRNLKGKVAATVKSHKGKVDNRISDEMEDIED